MGGRNLCHPTGTSPVPKLKGRSVRHPTPEIAESRLSGDSIRTGNPWKTAVLRECTSNRLAPFGTPQYSTPDTAHSWPACEPHPARPGTMPTNPGETGHACVYSIGSRLAWLAHGDQRPWNHSAYRPSETIRTPRDWTVSSNHPSEPIQAAQSSAASPKPCPSEPIRDDPGANPGDPELDGAFQPQCGATCV